MKTKLFTILTIVVLALLLAVPALAETGTIELTGGSLSIEAANISFTGYALDGVAHNNVAGETTDWTATDPTGSGAGWHLTIAATAFTNAASKTIALSGFKMTLLDTAITATAGNDKPASNMGTAAVLGDVQTFAHADADTGMGTYTMLPTFTLDVPAATYAGTYTSTVTLTIVSTPGT